MAILTDRCINPDCRELISYQEGTPEIRCPWCNHAFLAREFKCEQQKINKALAAGRKARAALALERKEKQALQTLLNKSQQTWIDYTEIHKLVETQLKKINQNTISIKGDTEQLLSGQKEILQAIRESESDTHKFENSLQSVHDCLRYGAFDSAKVLLDQALKINPKDSGIYLCRLLVELKLRSMMDLAHCPIDFSQNPNFKLAQKYASPELKKDLEKLSICARERRTIQDALPETTLPHTPVKKEGKASSPPERSWNPWEKMYDFEDRYAGMALIVNNNKYGLVNKDLQLVSSCIWDDIDGFCEGLAVVRSKGREGAINTRGELVIPCEWDRIWGFSDGLSIVRKPGDNKLGYIDQTGRLIIGCKWDDATDFQNGTANVKTTRMGLFGTRQTEYIIDKAGNILRKL